jgi:hypothetical protein
MDGIYTSPLHGIPGITKCGKAWSKMLGAFPSAKMLGAFPSAKMLGAFVDLVNFRVGDLLKGVR